MWDTFNANGRFSSIVKPKLFYEKHAKPELSLDSRSLTSMLSRCYFYNVDLQGRLFLEETFPKNIATSIKDERFLDFFFSHLRRTSASQRKWMDANGIPVDDYPFVSACGKELNFIRPAASPIVFHSLFPSQSENRPMGYFVYGGRSLVEPFDEHCSVAISKPTGRLYHKLTSLSLQPPGKESQDDVRSEYGLVRSSVAVALSERIVTDISHPTDTLSGLGFESSVDEMVVPIPWLPVHAEPGPWAMPFIFEE